jgi:hypothetical protein
MKLIKKSQAKKMIKALPFNTYTCKYCSGKYKWLGSEQKHIDKADVRDLSDDKETMLAAYVERRTDNDGPYAIIISVWCKA